MMINIVDDDEAVRDSLHMLLEELGHSVKTYASAEPLLRGDWDCDCLLIDQHMPGITGIDLLEHLRAKGDATPAVLVSGEPMAKSSAERAILQFRSCKNRSQRIR